MLPPSYNQLLANDLGLTLQLLPMLAGFFTYKVGQGVSLGLLARCALVEGILLAMLPRFLLLRTVIPLCRVLSWPRRHLTLQAN